MQVIDLFSGIGGASLAGKWAGWRTIYFCEIDPFCQKILSYYWPDVPIHSDIKTLTGEQILKSKLYDPNEPTIIVGGFPCQPFSAAGKRLGTEDDRALWPKMLRIIQEISPDNILAENVYGLVNWSGGLVFEQVQADLEACGYEVQPVILPACGVNAPHKRDRVWFVAHSINGGHRDSGGQNRKEDGIQGKHRSSLCAGMPDGADNGITPNPENNGLCRGVEQWGKNSIKQNRDGIEHTGIGRDEIRTEFERPGEGWVTSHTTGTGREERIESGGRSDSEETGAGLDNRPERYGSIGTIADTEGLRINRTQESKDGCGQSGERGRCDINDNGTVRQGDGNSPTSDTCNTGLQGREINGGVGEIGEIRKQQLVGSLPSDWSDFPTQPPVCGKYDGIPRKLDGITFSKWRNESIKGFGNAWVPEVALQIFNAINEYNKL